MPKFRDHFVPLGDLCIDNGTVVPGIAQLLFERGLAGIWLLLVYLWLRGLGNASSSMHTHTISEEAERAEKQNTRRVEHPDMPPGGLGCEWQDAMGKTR